VNPTHTLTTIYTCYSNDMCITIQKSTCISCLNRMCPCR